MTDDVLVLGGGFAGLTAARDLSERGLAVRLLEARDRLGGRTWSTTMPGTDVVVELGGTWFSPEGHPNVAREVARYSPRITEMSPFASVIQITSAGRFEHVGEEMSPSLREFYAPVAAPIAEACTAIRASRATTGRTPPELDIAATEWIDGLGAPLPVTEMLYAWMASIGGGDPAKQSILVMLSDLATGGVTLEETFQDLGSSFTDGTGALIDAMRADLRGAVELSTVVTSIRHTDERVTVTASDGRTFEARAAVIALPLNCWRDVAFDPPIHPSKSAASTQGHSGQSTKVLMFAGGLDVRTLISAWGHSFQGIVGMVDTDDGTVFAAFDGLRSLDDPTDREQIQAVMEGLVPGIQVGDTLTHDWNADPFSRGAWATWPPGWSNEIAEELGRPEGPLYFAGSDIALEDGGYGYIDGAIVTGRRAAEWVDARLRDPSARTSG